MSSEVVELTLDWIADVADFLIAGGLVEDESQELDDLMQGIVNGVNIDVHGYLNHQNRMVFGIQIFELTDSFLVALPAVLVEEDGVVEGRPLVGSPVIRLYKSSLQLSAPAEPEYLIQYLSFLVRKGKFATKLNGYLNSDREDYVQRVLKFDTLTSSQRNPRSKEIGDETQSGNLLTPLGLVSKMRH